MSTIENNKEEKEFSIYTKEDNVLVRKVFANSFENAITKLKSLSRDFSNFIYSKDDKFYLWDSELISK